jgi:hypothetical protein
MSRSNVTARDFDGKALVRAAASNTGHQLAHKHLVRVGPN